MELYNLLLSTESKKKLKDFSSGVNLKMSEVVRRAIDEFIENHKEDTITADGEFTKDV
jgi:lipopolysaccharide biosynthesis regulator YciM